jgi:hypothetical protein
MMMTAHPAPHCVYRLSPHAALESFAEGALLLRLTDRHLFELNPSAQRILELTDGQRSVMQVASALAQDFEIDEELARQDVLSLYADFELQGIVEIV